MKSDYVTAGRCKECSLLVPLLQKNKAIGRDAWECRNCGTLVGITEFLMIRMWRRVALMKQKECKVYFEELQA